MTKKGYIHNAYINVSKDSINLFWLRWNLHEVTNEAVCIAHIIKARCVRPLGIVTTAFKNRPITTSQEAVANVTPLIGVHVVVLDAPDRCSACVKVIAGGSF